MPTGLNLNTLASDVNQYTKNVLDKNETIKNLKIQSDLKAQQEATKKAEEEKLLKENSSVSWWNKRTKVQKGLVIGGGLVLLGVSTFLIYKLITKK